MTFDPIEERDATIAELRTDVKWLRDWQRQVCDHFGYDSAEPSSADEVLTCLPVWKGEAAGLRAEAERLKRGGKELGRILDRALRDALDASGRHDVIGEDGDGDWPVVWETLAELRPRAEAAEAKVAKVDALHHPWYEVNGVRHDHTVHVYGADAPSDHVCRLDGPEYDRCVIEAEPEDSLHVVLACYECRCPTEDGDPGYLLWPCATARALASVGRTEPEGQQCASCGGIYPAPVEYHHSEDECSDTCAPHLSQHCSPECEAAANCPAPVAGSSGNVV